MTESTDSTRAVDVASSETPSGASSSRLRRNALSNIAGRALSAVLWIAVTPYVLHTLGKERFGVWALIFRVTGYVGILDFGMGGGVSRFIAVAVARRDRGAARQLILRSILLSGVLGLVWMLVFIAGRDFFLQFFHVTQTWRGEVRSSLVVFGASLLVLSMGQVLLWCLMGFQRLDLWNLYFLIGLAVNIAVLAAGLAAGYGLMATAVGALAGNIAMSLFSWGAIRTHVATLEPREGGERTPWRELLRFGAMVQASNAFSLGQMQVGIVMLGALGQLVWVTHFELGFRVTYALWSLSWVIQNAAYPALVHAYEVGGVAPMRQVYEWCCRWVFVMAAWTLGLVWLVAPALFRVWLGEVDPEVVLSARWLVLAFALATLAGPTSPVARGTGAPWLEVLNFGLAFATNLLACFWLIPWGGAMGAAIAMAISYVVASTTVLVVVHRRIGVANGSWLTRLALPRLLPAALAAAILGVATSRWSTTSRAEAFALLCVQGVLYTIGFVLMTWPTGDPKTVWRYGRGWLKRMGRAGAVEAPVPHDRG